MAGRRLLALGVLAALGCGGAPHRTDRPNLLVIVVDALRADRVGAARGGVPLTPFLDSLAERAWVFRHAYAASAWTQPSIASLITSRFQSEHGFVALDSVLGAAEVTLPEVLKEHGYVTGAVSANGLLASRSGFAQGYDRYRAFWVQKAGMVGGTPRWRNVSAPRVGQEALAWLASLRQRRAGPVFLYLHYVETHTPYDPPPEFLDRALAGRPRPDLDEVERTYYRGVLHPLPADELATLEAVYDAAVMAVDAELRKLFDALQRLGFLENAVVVVTADHGDEFKDHGFVGHGGTLYEELIHVPLLVMAPGAGHGVIETVVSLVDVAPTLLDLAGVPVPASFEGRSLGTVLARAAAPAPVRALRRLVARDEPGTAYSELIVPPADVPKRVVPHERALVVGRRKIITGFHGEREVYDLAADPGEHHARDPHDAGAEELHAALARVAQHAAERAAAGSTAPLDAETVERLRALGYVR